MTKTRTLSEAEQKARKKYEGLTRRQYNATEGRHAKHRRKSRNGSFEVVALFVGKTVPDTAPFPNEAAALARFDRLSTNPALLNVKVVEHRDVFNADNVLLGKRSETLYALTTMAQEFANSRAPWWESRA